MKFMTLTKEKKRINSNVCQKIYFRIGVNDVYLPRKEGAVYTNGAYNTNKGQ
jgi:hypothetical protein